MLTTTGRVCAIAVQLPLSPALIEEISPRTSHSTPAGRASTQAKSGERCFGIRLSARQSPSACTLNHFSKSFLRGTDANACIIDAQTTQAVWQGGKCRILVNHSAALSTLCRQEGVLHRWRTSGSIKSHLDTQVEFADAVFASGGTSSP